MTSKSQNAYEQLHESRVAVYCVRARDVGQSGADDSRACASGVTVTKVAFVAGAFDVDGDVGVEVQQCAPLAVTSAIDDVGSAPRVCRAASGHPCRER